MNTIPDYVPEFFARQHGLGQYANVVDSTQTDTDGHGQALTQTYTDLHGLTHNEPQPSGVVDDRDNIPIVDYSELSSFASCGNEMIHAGNQMVYKELNGDKFLGGFGQTHWLLPDYWTLRLRSKQMFSTNIYGRGIIGRFVTNVINTGLMLEAIPEQSTIGWTDEQIEKWSETTENRFGLWGSNKKLCDFKEEKTFGGLQAAAYLEALISGDVLVTLRQGKDTGLPLVKLVSGSLVRDPSLKDMKKRNIKHGVERDKNGKHIGFWVEQEDGTYKRIAAYDSNGRRIAWLKYGTDKMMDDVRGEPLLSIVLQSLKEIDRYRDSAQRKAVVNSLVAFFIEREGDDAPSFPFTGGAQHNTKIKVKDSDCSARTIKTSNAGAGQVWEGLKKGEKPKLLGGQGTDVNFHVFEDAIISAISWCYGIPPEIIKLSFTNNYSASQAALNEFKIWLNFKRKIMGDDFCSPIYEEWCISEALNGTFAAPGFLESWRDKSRFYEYTAWIQSDWIGAIKPTTDILKLVKGYKMAIAEGLITRDQATKELTGRKYSKTVKKLFQENKALARANQPFLEAAESSLESGGNDVGNTKVLTHEEAAALLDDSIESRVEEIIDARVEEIIENLQLTK